MLNIPFYSMTTLCLNTHINSFFFLCAYPRHPFFSNIYCCTNIRYYYSNSQIYDQVAIHILIYIYIYIWDLYCHIKWYRTCSGSTCKYTHTNVHTHVYRVILVISLFPTPVVCITHLQHDLTQLNLRLVNVFTCFKIISQSSSLNSWNQATPLQLVLYLLTKSKLCSINKGLHNMFRPSVEVFRWCNGYTTAIFFLSDATQVTFNSALVFLTLTTCLLP